MISNKKDLHKIAKLTRKGYTIRKDQIDPILYKKLRKSLKVKPFTHKDYAKFAEEFYVFSENSSKIYLPRFWAINNLGMPSNIQLTEGTKINVECKYDPLPIQKPIIDKIYKILLSKNGTILSVGCGIGKCHGINTPILMYDGTIKMVQDIEVGEQIMGDDSTPRNVLSLARGREQMYKIIPKRGTPYIVNESHILSLRCSTPNKRFGKKGDILDISVKDYLQLPKSYNNSRGSPLCGYKVPVDFPEKQVFNPYIIGLWLGDGTSSGSGFTTNNHQIIKYLKEELPKYKMYLRYKSKYDYAISNDKSKQHNYFNSILRKYNLLNNKHIPHIYKCNSRENRLKLLAGLLDSDGYMKNNTHSITQKNEKLLDDIVYLCLSLGFYAEKKIRWKRCTNGKNKEKRKYFQTSISGFGIEEIPIKINRKKCQPRKQIKDPLNSIITVEKIDIDNYYGFTLDGNHRYLLGDYTVTHNTYMSLFISSKLGYKTLVIVHTSVLLQQWKERITQFLPDARIGFIRGNKFETENKDICVAMLQTLVSPQRKFQKDAFEDFGFLIVDECFPGNQHVLTYKGYIKIEKLYQMWEAKEELPLIKSYNQKKKKFEFKKMTYAWKKEETEEIIKLDFFNKITVKCTPNHKFLTFNKQSKKYIYIEAHKLTKKHLVVALHGKIRLKKSTKTKLKEPIAVYDIEVEDNHNFVVNHKPNPKNSPTCSNCHHLGAPIFSRALPKVATKYMLGLSATPDRADKLEKVFKWYLGDMGYYQTKRSGFLITKYIKYTDDNFEEKRRWNNSYNLPEMVKLIINSVPRNMFIVQEALKLAQSGRQILLLSARINHLKLLKKMLNHYKDIDPMINVIKKMFPYKTKIQKTITELYRKNITFGLYIGGLKKEVLKESSKCDIILGSYSLVSEGTDIPTLNTLIMASPKKSIQQVVGRILRAETGFTPLVIDICDDFSIYTNQGYSRIKYYNMQEYHIDTFTKYQDESVKYKGEDIILDDTIQTEGYKKKKRGRKSKTINKKINKEEAEEQIKNDKCMLVFSDDSN